MILNGFEEYLSEKLTEKIQQITKILSLILELKIQAIVSLKIEDEEEEKILKSKMHFFANEIWNLEDQKFCSPENSENQYVLEFKSHDKNSLVLKEVALNKIKK